MCRLQSVAARTESVSPTASEPARQQGCAMMEMTQQWIEREELKRGGGGGGGQTECSDGPPADESQR